ncbi:MAG: sigma-54 dependent transcriptional regulator [Alphaproteobacteria bacterium]|uniref:Sigma-54 dependent transcriptional regulator n=1 Tax=Candidatus Nitrobium versatile TaxID=2884831 RepID=A0A953M1R7_9BACT|nr:sigma-54 dependent transcriptional regulator [Candidatus Nitrobium versatile]
MRGDRVGKVLLIIDDDKLLCDALQDYFRTGGMEVLAAYTGEEGLALCARKKVDVVLLDQNLPDTEGHALCPVILKHNEQSKIIFITAHPSFEGAVKAIKSGAHDYLSKPFEMEELSLAIKNALNTLALEKIAQIERYKRDKESEEAVLVGSSPGLVETVRLVDLAASTDAPVLITGETGTGKNVAARSIHYKSNAHKEAFISINCAALPEGLIEAELFGYEKGAFTGATASRRGIFEMAEGGTLFLDEIGEMPMHLQTKLLSALEDKKIRRLGGDFIRPVSVRIIAASSADLEASLGKTFRSDLYYRLSVIRIHIPPLRERRQDIPELCDYILRKVTRGREAHLSEPELQRLIEYDWPGNIRELKNVIERASLLQKGPLLAPSDFLVKVVPARVCPPGFPGDDLIPLEAVERSYIRYVLQKLSGNHTRAARTLGISLSTLKRKLKEYQLRE